MTDHPDYRPAPKPAFPVVVCGSAAVPEAFVHRKLDALTAAKRLTHNVVLVLGDGEDAANEWARADERRLFVSYEPFLDLSHGRRYGPVRWAMKVVAEAQAVVIFGDPESWWRVARYAGQAGIPVRYERPPAGANPPPQAVARPPARTRPEPPPPPAPFTGTGPLGLPH